MKKRYLGSLFLLLINISAIALVRNFPDLFFPAYRNFSKIWLTALSTITGIVPFSLWDLLAVVLLVLFVITLMMTIIRKRNIFNYLSYILLIISILLTIAVFGWLLNHYAPPLSTYIDLPVSEYSKEELYESCDYYLKKAAEHALLIDRDGEDHVRDYDFYETAKSAGAAYEKLADEYEVFKGSTIRVKRFTLIGDYLLYNGIVGMFMPLSGEASVPYHIPVVPMPFNMAHEAAHRLGIASEQEANFCAFLACISSEDERFLYSGYYSAFSYCFSSLYSVDSEKALSLYEKYADDRGVLLVRLDRSDTAKIYQKYESPLREVSDKINDTYLKTFDQEEGIRSYGMVTDYLIAYRLKQD